MTATQQFDEMNDNEKVNLYIQDENNNIMNSDTKKNISTQVDYVALIMAKNNQEFEDEYTKSRKKLQQLPMPEKNVESNIQQVNSLTIHSDHDASRGKTRAQLTISRALFSLELVNTILSSFIFF